MATRMARATPSITASGSTPGCWRRRENSLKPARKICSTPQSGSGLLPAWRYSLDRSMPDQKRSSNSSRDFFAARSMVLRWKIMIQEVTDAATRVSMTSCTTKLALLIRLHIDLWSTALAVASTLLSYRSCCDLTHAPGEGCTQRLGDGTGFQTVGPHAGHHELPLAEQHLIRRPPHLLTKTQAGAVQLHHLGRDENLVVQPGR